VAVAELLALVEVDDEVVRVLLLLLEADSADTDDWRGSSAAALPDATRAKRARREKARMFAEGCCEGGGTDCENGLGEMRREEEMLVAPTPFVPFRATRSKVNLSASQCQLDVMMVTFDPASWLLRLVAPVQPEDGAQVQSSGGGEGRKNQFIQIISAADALSPPSMYTLSGGDQRN
jgi:hypothetical protein